MAKIGIVQIDGKMPNLALMKIAGYHESKQDTIEWYNGILFNEQYDKLYASKIFSFSKTPQLPKDAIIGGTGFNFYNRLPEEIETAKPSYSIYPDCNFHLGFSTKGCRFKCKFCCVPQKEGKTYNYNTIDEILTNPNGGNRLLLLDNDFFGGTHWELNLQRIIDLKLKVCFNQGINIQTITEEQSKLLAKCNYQNSKFNQKYLSFSWDNYRDHKAIMKGIERCVLSGIRTKEMQFYVLIGYDSTPEQDMERVILLNSLGCIPFVMKYNKDDKYQKAFARWVNFRSIFKTVDWKDYLYNYNIQ